MAAVAPIEAGPKGEKGPPGEKGSPGDRGDEGFSGRLTVIISRMMH